MDISVGCGGLSDLKSHLTTRVHKSNAEACKTNQMLNTFYVSKKDDNMNRNNEEQQQRWLSRPGARIA